ncbi:hypothetical protein [Actinoplanes couchii]|nr:hypothetical protein [Actinoplanes couchii]
MIIGVVAGLTGVLVLTAVAGTALLSGGGAGCVVPLASAASGSERAGVSGWDSDQLANARTIIAVGTQRGVPARGWVIALATAMQESGLRNLTGGDRDSVGLFQQRPSQGWGTPAQLHDPAYAAGKFYDRLATVAGWQGMPLTEAAQAVQRSAYPDAYAKWEDDAVAIVQQQSPASGSTLGCLPAMIGDAEPAPRNTDGSWPEESCVIRPDPTTGTGCVTPRLLHLVQQATAAGFPKPSCYRVDDHGEHPQGRACDWMMTAGGEASGTQKLRGDTMAAWTVANADRLAIRYVIWFRMIWTDDGRGWHAYHNPVGGDDPSGWHTNHVHISIH